MNALHALILIAATAPVSQQVVVGQNVAVESATTIAMGRGRSEPIVSGMTRYSLETSKQFIAVPRVEDATMLPPSASIQALGRLRAFEGWPPNWDGEGAPAPKRGALVAAANLLGLLEDEILETPAVALDAAGEPTFILMKDGREMSVTVRSPRYLAFYILGNGVEEAGSSRFSGERLPRRLLQALRTSGIA